MAWPSSEARRAENFSITQLFGASVDYFDVVDDALMGDRPMMRHDEERLAVRWVSCVIVVRAFSQCQLRSLRILSIQPAAL